MSKHSQQTTNRRKDAADINLPPVPLTLTGAGGPKPEAAVAVVGTTAVWTLEIDKGPLLAMKVWKTLLVWFAAALAKEEAS